MLLPRLASPVKRQPKDTTRHAPTKLHSSNKACSGFVGVCAVYKHFSGFGFFLLSGIFPARPQTTNANRWAVPFKNMKTLIIITLLAILLVSCAPVSKPAPISTPTDTPQPTVTFTLIPTLTPVVSTLEGVLFFDMNGSGLRDNASFMLMLDENEKPPLIIQKLFPEITGNNGDVLLVDEPGLAGFNVCAVISGKQYCGVTDSDGKYSITDIPVALGTKVNLTITDPNAENAQLSMMYIIQWIKMVVIPAYEMNEVKVPEQHLNDTRMASLSTGIYVSVGELPLQIGLMQGFITSPLLCGQDYKITSWYDHNLQNGAALNYAGLTYPYIVNQSGETISWDNHSGIDFDVPDGTFVVAMAAGVVNFSGNIGEILHITIDHMDRKYATGTGHHSVLLVKFDEPVYRGQIIALSGHSGTNGPHIHLNFHYYEIGVEPPPSRDPFGVLYSSDDVTSLISYWSEYDEIVCSK